MRVKSRFNIIVLSVLLMVTFPLKVLAAAPGETTALFDQYSWVEIVKPFLIVVLVALFVLYLWGMHNVSRKHNVKHRVWKGIAFLGGLVMIYVSLGGPIAIYASNLTFSAHATQQGLMYIGMPLLILLGMPRVFYEVLHTKLFSRKFMRLFRLPIISIFTFNLLVSFFHIPFIYEYLVQRIVLLETSHILINAAAFMMWIHVLAPIGLINHMSNVLKIGYMFLNGLLLMPLSALVIFSGDVIYPSIYEAPLPFSFSTFYDDQKLGILILQSLQELFYILTISFTYFRWAKAANVQKVDELPDNPYENGSSV